MENNLPVVDYAAAEGPAEPSATWRCPTGAIRWVEGEQFQEIEPEEPRKRRAAGE
jgi:hypothetical protein